VIWLHTFGERFVGPEEGRPTGPPRLPLDLAPDIPREGKIPSDVEHFPNCIDYDASKRRLNIGTGFIDNVPPSVWAMRFPESRCFVSGSAIERRIGNARKSATSGPLLRWEEFSQLIGCLNIRVN
jgi:hypothetical protein